MIPGVVRDVGAAERGARSRDQGHVSLRLRRVLVIDEALPIRRKLLEVLHRSGLAGGQIATAATADEALEAFARDHPPLVFAEFIGPDEREGLALILELLRLDPQAKIVLVTAEAPESDLVRQAVRHGVFAVVRKPLRHEKIRQVLTEIEAEEGGIERFR